VIVRLLTALAVAATLSVVVPQAPASAAAPTLTLVPTLDPTYPLQVPTSGTTPIRFTVTSSEATPVEASASGDGLEATPVPPGEVSGAKGFAVDVRGLAPGFHTLEVAVQVAGQPDTRVAVRLAAVWTSGSPTPPPGGDLRGRAYGWQGPAGETDMVSFVTKELAYRGLPTRGRPRCKAVGGGCVPYSFDPATGLVQVGTDLIGRVAGDTLVTSGLARSSVPGEVFAQYVDGRPLTYAGRRTRLVGRWSLDSKVTPPTGVAVTQVTFRRNGAFRLRYVADGRAHRLNGRYLLRGQGKVLLRTHRKRTSQVGTLLLAGTKVGKANPRAYGLWLVLGGTKRGGSFLVRGA
jgi:hypothetical protein